MSAQKTGKKPVQEEASRAKKTGKKPAPGQGAKSSYFIWLVAKEGHGEAGMSEKNRKKNGPGGGLEYEKKRKKHGTKKTGKKPGFSFFLPLSKESYTNNMN